MPLIEGRDLSCSSAQGIVFEKGNFQIEAGECVGVFGPNGAGKSTLLKALLGLVPIRGSLTIRGEKVVLSRSLVGYVPQGIEIERRVPAVVSDIVLSGLLRDLRPFRGYDKIAKRKAIEALIQVGLSNERDIPFAKLSGGQQRRVLLARALVAKPKILLLDEPTANLDTSTTKSFYNLLEQLHGKVTILLVTHLLEPVLPFLSYALLVHQQRIHRLSTDKLCSHNFMSIFHQ